jgi:tetrahydrodipicolinate N-succinyltransferase
MVIGYGLGGSVGTGVSVGEEVAIGSVVGSGVIVGAGVVETHDVTNKPKTNMKVSRKCTDLFLIFG